MKNFLSITLSLLAAGQSAFATFENIRVQPRSALVAQPLLKQGPGGVPLIELSRDFLYMAQNEGHKLHIAKLTANGFSTPFQEVSIGGANSSITSDASSGWVSACTDGGNSIVSFRRDDPASAQRYNFPVGVTGCFSLHYDPSMRAVSPEQPPLAWTGSTGDRRILLLDVQNGAIAKDFGPISGPFSLIPVGNSLFTLNGIISPVMDVPYALDKNSGATLLGNALGDESHTNLKREYTPAIFDDSAVTGKVYYIHAQDGQLHGFSSKNPSDLAITKVVTKLERPVAVSRFGSCLAVLGQVDNYWSYPKWSILKANENGELKIVAVTEVIEDKTFNGSVYQQIDSFGNVYLGHWKGVTKISGLFADLDCK